MTLQQLYEYGKTQLEQAGVPDAVLDARYLLLDSFQMDMASYLLRRGRELDMDDALIAAMRSTYLSLIQKRSGRVPLQHLTGVQEFMGLNFCVNQHVLIPRQDTETLVELVLKEQDDPRASVLDLCTGSGCIALSLAVLGGYLEVTACDLSAEALEVAGTNAGRLLRDYRGTFRLAQGDLFQGIPKHTAYDMIVSNPPYIPTAVIQELEPEVRDYEPRLALDGAVDGLEFYRRIAAGSAAYLKPGGVIYMEIGCDQGEAVAGMFAAAGYERIRIVKDLAGQDRVVRAALYN